MGALGPVLGGWLIDSVGWRTIFLINLPLALGAIGLAWRFIPTDRDGRDRPIDGTGALLATVGLAAATWALTLGSGPAGWTLRSGFMAMAAVVSFVLFVVVERQKGERANDSPVAVRLADLRRADRADGAAVRSAGRAFRPAALPFDHGRGVFRHCRRGRPGAAAAGAVNQFADDGGAGRPHWRPPAAVDRTTGRRRRISADAPHRRPRHLLDRSIPGDSRDRRRHERGGGPRSPPRCSPRSTSGTRVPLPASTAPSRGRAGCSRRRWWARCWQPGASCWFSVSTSPRSPARWPACCPPSRRSRSSGLGTIKTWRRAID